MRPPSLRGWLALGIAAAVTASAVALAQRSDVRVPLTVTVGQAGGPEPVLRGSPYRDGLVHDPLPRGPLKVDWHYGVGGGQVEQPPLVTRDAIIVLTTHGDVVWLPHEGREGHTEIARQPIGISVVATSAPVVLAGGTVVVVGGTTEAVAVGVDKSGVRFRTALTGIVSGSGALEAVAPLALGDGGVAVATSEEIVLLDSAGNIRSRASLPEPLAGPLLAAQGRIFATSRTGVVFAWAPGGTGGSEVARVGSFGDELGGGAVLTSNDTLMAVVRDARLMTLDVRQGLAVPLATFPGGAFLGPPAYRRSSGTAYVLAGLPGHTYVLGLDSTGQEVLRVPVATSLALAVDGGVPVYTPPAHVPVMVDDTGTVAFAAPEGSVGVVDPAGVVSSLDSVCARTFVRNGRTVTSLAGDGPGAFLVTCSSSLVRVVHD